MAGKAKPKPASKARYYIRIQDGFVDLRNNPKPGHSYVWLIERDGAANEGRLNGCMLSVSANALVEYLESLGVEVQRVHAPAGDSLHVGDKSDPQLMPEVRADATSRDLPPDVIHGTVRAVVEPEPAVDFGELVEDLTL